MPALLFAVIAGFITAALFAADPEPAQEPPRRLALEHPLKLYELRAIQSG